jgi:hypothetical protein
MIYRKRGKCTSNWFTSTSVPVYTCTVFCQKKRDKITLAVIARLSDLVHTIAKSPLQWSAGTRTHSRQIHRSILYTCLHLDRFRIIRTHVCARATKLMATHSYTRPDRLPLRYATLRLLLCVALQSGGYRSITSSLTFRKFTAMPCHAAAGQVLSYVRMHAPQPWKHTSHHTHQGRCSVRACMPGTWAECP